MGGSDFDVPTLADFAAQDRDMIISCWHPACRRQVALTPAEAIQLLGPNCTIEEADRRLQCSACGARGRDGFVQARFSTISRDYYERNYRPQGVPRRGQ